MHATEINTSRIDYLLELFGMSKDELLAILNDGRKRLLSIDDIFGSKIQFSTLKKIDKIFKKGISFYIDFSTLPIKNSSKVLFRKKHLTKELSLEDKRIVDSFESLKNLLDGYRMLSETKDETYPFMGIATIKDSPREIADKVRSNFIPAKDIKVHRDFLKGIIECLANINIYVFEFIEAWNKKDKADIDGFYLYPNVIVIKRQKSYKREIFTLAHELGHYVLGKEDIESLDMSKIDQRKIDNKIERWCNDFAFYLIAGESVNLLDGCDVYSEDMNQIIDILSHTTHISRMAWYTKLAIEKKVPLPRYYSIISDLEKENEEKEKIEKEDKQKLSGHPSTPKPIISPLYLETMQFAYFNGLISESTFCEQLRIPKNKIDKYLW